MITETGEMMKQIILECYRVQFVSKGKYDCDFFFNNIPIHLELPNPPVPGTKYELLIKGVWGDDERLYPCLTAMQSLSGKNLKLENKD